MKISGRTVAIGWLALLLGGCATRVDLVESGEAPVLAGGFALARDADAEAGAPLLTRLGAAGLVWAQASAAYLREITRGERPWPVGAYSGAGTPEEREAWLAPPQSRPLWAPRTTKICTLSVRVISAADGHEAYRVRASARGRGPGCGQSEALTAAIAGKLAASGQGR